MILVLSILLANLFAFSLSAVINPIGTRLTFGARQTIITAVGNVLFASVMTLPAMLYALLSRRGKATIQPLDTASYLRNVSK